MTNDLKNEIITKIKTESLHPKPRWQILLVDWVWWVIFGGAVFVGSLVLSVAISYLAQNDWRLYSSVMGLSVSDILSSLPLFWLVVILVTVWLASHNLELTRRGYQLKTPKLIGVILTLSFFVGSFSYFIGWGDELENFSARLIPHYQNFNSASLKLWSNPDKGLLGGEIIAVADQKNLLVRDFNGQDWLVTGEDIDWLGGARPKNGSKIKIIGRTDDKEGRVFIAEVIQLWRP